VDAPVHQYRYLSDCETQNQRDLVLEVYRQLFERFGALPDLVLIQLASTGVEQLTELRRTLPVLSSLDGVASKAGWVVPQGGEGNYPMDADYEARLLSCDEQHLVEERLASLRQLQRTYDLEVPAVSQTLDWDEHRHQRPVEVDVREPSVFIDAPQFEMTPM
jgi:hypothetical protein